MRDKPALEPVLSVTSFRELVREHREEVCQLAASFGVPEGAADDVAQGVFLVLWRALQERRVTSSVRPWLRTVTRRFASRYRRSERRDRAEVSGESAPPEGEELGLAPSSEELLLATEAVAIQSQLVGDLPPPVRAVVLPYLRGDRVEDIARALGIPEATAYNRLRIARRDLEAGWERRCAREARSGDERPFAVLPFFWMWREEHGPESARTRPPRRSPIAIALAFLVLFDTRLRSVTPAAEAAALPETSAISPAERPAAPPAPPAERTSPRHADESPARAAASATALPTKPSSGARTIPRRDAAAPVRRERDLETARILLDTADRMAAEGHTDAALAALRAYDVQEPNNPLPATRAAHPTRPARPEDLAPNAPAATPHPPAP